MCSMAWLVQFSVMKIFLSVLIFHVVVVEFQNSGGSSSLLFEPRLVEDYYLFLLVIQFHSGQTYA
jgi:hypothetical protein